MPPIKRTKPKGKHTSYDFKSFITGSYAYGKPTNRSDIDLVVFVSEEDLPHLISMADSCKDRWTASGLGGDGKTTFSGGTSLRFGKLNLICVTDSIRYATWLIGTEQLKQHAPVTKGDACNHFNELREEAGLLNKEK